ncbi:MAG: hypothetical protein JKY19_04425 [Alcanivoracaceae bacterium]|nr:hypothetical protein [Alcanivoracaceae bacterium]
MKSQKNRQHKKLTLSQYVHRRNGVALGAPGSLRNMLYRSLGAATFAEFWRYWNPVWGYGLGKYIFTPLKRIFPTIIALIMTFVFSGLLHDLAIIIVKGSVVIIFAPWFLLLGIGVVLGQELGINFSSKSWLFRASINLIYLIACYILSRLAMSI